MLTSIPYAVKPETTPYNIAVFLLNFANRTDGKALGEAFCHDFDILPDIQYLTCCNTTALRMIARDYLA